MQVTSHRNESAGFSQEAAASAQDDLDGLKQARLEEWLSAYMDGELADEADDAAAAVSGYLETGGGRADWDLYHLVGDVVRTPELALSVSSGFHQRFLDALEHEAPIVAAPDGPSRAASWHATVSPAWPRRRRRLGDLDRPALFRRAGRAGRVFRQCPASRGAGRRPGCRAGGARRAEPPVDVSLGEYLEAHRQIAGRSAIRQVSATSFEPAAGQR